jgi:hypothetical protein
MTEDETYQGWTNRETWAASLHLSNTEWLYNGARDAIIAGRREAGEDAGPFTAANALEAAVMDIVGQNREAHDDAQPTGGDITMMDREVGSWWRVNWREVAEGLMDR